MPVREQSIHDTRLPGLVAPTLEQVLALFLLHSPIVEFEKKRLEIRHHLAFGSTANQADQLDVMVERIPGVHKTIALASGVHFDKFFEVLVYQNVGWEGVKSMAKRVRSCHFQ